MSSRIAASFRANGPAVVVFATAPCVAALAGCATHGRNWTKDVSGYQAAPIPSDNVVYEVHGYPPLPLQYGSATLPVIVGEYGSLQALSARLLFADFENKQVTSLAWVFEPFVDCQPDLLDVTARADLLVPSTWGRLVRDYLRAHAR